MLVTIAIGGAAGTGVGIVHFSPAVSVALVAVAAAVLVAVFILRRHGTRGLSSVALAAAAATLGMNGVRLTTSVALSDVFLLLAAIILLPGLFVHAGQRLAPAKWLTGGTLLIVLGGLVGSAVATDPSASIAQLWRFSVAAVLVPVLFALWRPTVPEIRRISWLWVASVTVSAIVAIGESGSSYHHGRADGLTTHPNHLALTCVIAVGPAVVLTLLARGMVRWLGLFSCAVLGLGLLISGSRAGVVGFVLALLVMAVLTRRVAIAGGIAAAAVAAAILLFSGVVNIPAGNALARLIGSDDRTVVQGVLASDAERREEFDRTLDQVFAHPFTGVGFENALAAHDIYLQVWASAGVLGIAGLAIIVTALLNRPIRAFLGRSSPVNASAMLLVGYTASFIGYLGTGLFQNALWDRYLWLAPAVIAGLTPYAVGSLVGSRSDRSGVVVAHVTNRLQPIHGGEHGRVSVWSR